MRLTHFHAKGCRDLQVSTDRRWLLCWWMAVLLRCSLCPSLPPVTPDSPPVNNQYSEQVWICVGMHTWQEAAPFSLAIGCWCFPAGHSPFCHPGGTSLGSGSHNRGACSSLSPWKVPQRAAAAADKTVPCLCYSAGGWAAIPRLGGPVCCFFYGRAILWVLHILTGLEQNAFITWYQDQEKQ